MTQATLSDISSKMRKLDICMMTTQSIDGSLTSRPMSNNRDVEYDGESFFFSLEDSEAVTEIKEKAVINLAFQGDHKLYISISGNAEIITDKDILQKHWVDELDRWFEDGINTPGIVLIHVKATHIKYWHKQEESEIHL